MIDFDRLAADGFTTTALLDQDTIDQLRSAFERSAPRPIPAFFASANDPDREIARSAHDQILDVVGAALEAVLPRHRPFLASYLVKAPHDGARISFHQDLTYTDERVARTLVLWVPLTEVDQASGALELIAGSHRWTEGCRPAGQPELPTDAIQERLAAHACRVPITTGSAIAYDPATVHGSPPNRSIRPRVAIGVALAPVGADLVHCHADSSGVTAYRINDAHHRDLGPLQRPEHALPAAPWAPPVCTDDFLKALGSPSCVR